MSFPGGSDNNEFACKAGDPGFSPGSGRSPGKEMDDPLEKEMTTHSIIFAWRIPRTEEPGGLYSMGSQRVPD